MARLKIRIVTAMILLLASYGYAQTGFRIKSVSRITGGRHFMDDSEQTSTAYVLRNNSRVEMPHNSAFGTEPSEEMVIIQHCADHVMYALNFTTHEYSEMPVPGLPPKDKNAGVNQPEGPPNLLIETMVRDTGETKPAFGHTARHYVITTKQTPSPELGMEPGETNEDAWYLDIPDPRMCTPRPHRGGGFVGGGVGIGRGGPADFEKIRPEFKHSGPDPEGLMISSRKSNKAIEISRSGERREIQYTFSNEIVEMSEEPVDPSLFEIPSGFKKVIQPGRQN